MVVINACFGHTNLNNYFKLKKVFVFTKETENRSIEWSVACWSLHINVSFYFNCTEGALNTGHYRQGSVEANCISIKIEIIFFMWSMNKGRATSTSALNSFIQVISMRLSVSDDTQRLKPRLFSTSGADSCSQQRRIHPSTLVWKRKITSADIGSLNTRCSPWQTHNPAETCPGLMQLYTHSWHYQQAS